MFKKLLPLIVVFALLATYAGYRAVSAQAIGAGNSQNDHSLRNVDPGALSPGFAYWQMQVARMNAVTGPVTSLDSAPAAFLDWARVAGFKSWTNLSTGDVAYEQSYVDPNDCNIPRVRSPGARAAPVPSC